MGLARAFDWLFPTIGILRDKYGDHSIIETYNATDGILLRRNGIKCRDVVCAYDSRRIRFTVSNDQAAEAQRLLSEGRK